MPRFTRTVRYTSLMLGLILAGEHGAFVFQVLYLWCTVLAKMESAKKGCNSKQPQKCEKLSYNCVDKHGFAGVELGAFRWLYGCNW